MSLEPGTSLLHYRLIGKIGAGGMGEVWKATDTTLGREVAIKILPAEFAADAERLSRFEREAKLLASLNHPGIAGIYGLHEAGTTRFLAMELVPGEDLAERLKAGRIPLPEALDVARQIAEALEAAHEQGVIHRDLKPANVKITPEGRVKVLDFGLAKAFETAVISSSGRDAGLSPTVTSLGTVAGVIIGTAAYMSPEQARGKTVDKRADIWAFGCVLFEMLAGKRPFEGETVSDTLAAVLAREPDWDALPPTVPVKVRDLLNRCLEKDAKKRVRDMGDARLELDAVIAERTASGRIRVAPDAASRAAAPRPSLGRIAAIAVAGVLVGTLAGIWIGGRRAPAGGDRGTVRLDLDFPSSVKILEYAVTADGSAIVARGGPRVAPGEPDPPPRLYVRRLDSGVTVVQPGSEGCQGFGVSADGRSITMGVPVTAGSSQFSIVRVPIDGSAPPLTLSPFDPRWTTLATLNNGDVIAIVDGKELVRIPESGAGPGPPVKIDFGGVQGRTLLARFALPGDKAVLFHTIVYGSKGWYYRVGALDLTSARVTYLFDDGGYPTYVPPGRIVYTRGDALLAIGFDLDTMKVTGTPVPIASGLRTDFSIQPALFNLSGNGVLVYEPGGRVAEGRRIGLIGPGETVTPVVDERHPYETARGGSSDGRRFATTVTNGQGIDELFVGEIDRPGLRRLFAVPDADLLTPVISPDGRRVAFGRRGRNPDDGIYLKELDDPSPPRRIAAGLHGDNLGGGLWCFTADGSGLLGVDAGANNKGDIVFYAVPPAGQGPVEPRPVIAGPADEGFPALSPDGRWLAYSSDESGRPEIYVVAFGRGVVTGETVRVTRSGGSTSRWSADGRQLRYQAPDGRIMSVPVATSPALSVGSPVFLFDAAKLNIFVSNVLPDGRQLAIIRGEEESDEVRRLSIVLDWTRELETKLKAASR